MAHSCYQFFLNDLVCLKANNAIRGYVTHSNNINEELSSDGETTEGKHMKRRARGLIKVRWLRSRSAEPAPRSWTPASKLELLDRVFRLGELVSDPKNECQGTGRVVGFNSTVTIVNTLTGRIKEGVLQKDLTHFSNFDLDSSICILYQGWLGWVDSVEYRYILKKEGASEDDAIVCVTNPQYLSKLRSQPTPFRGERFIAAGFEVGQRLSGRPYDFDRLAGVSQRFNRKDGQINARIIRKFPRAIEVIWVEKDCRVTKSIQPPPSRLIGPQVQSALIFPGPRHADFQIGDQVRFGDSPVEDDIDDDMAGMSFLYSGEERAEERYPWVITERKSLLGVFWQTGIQTQAATSIAPHFHHSDHDFWPGQLVTRHNDRRRGQVLSVDPLERICNVEWTVNGEDLTTFETGVSIYELQLGLDNIFHPGDVVALQPQVSSAGVWIGRFTGRYANGKAEIAWVDSKSSFVDVQHLVRLEPVVGKEATSATGWQVPVSAWESASSDSAEDSDIDLEDWVHLSECSTVAEDSHTLATVEEEEFHDHFPGFAMKDEVPDDHRYLDNKPGSSTHFLKRMHWEHGVLQANLPKGIWVRGFAPRLDLLRVVMIGPLGTPYASGAYCFDLFMDPATFPESPPHCHFWSQVGPRTDETRPLNPNLYPSGRVCLSLLGTWEGQAPQEQWSSASSILQLVISLQSLVLVSYPFFNEAGYDRMLGTPEGIRHSYAYNEHAFLLSLTTIPLSIQNPPFPFEAPLRNYYAKALPSLLNRLHLLNDEKTVSSALQNFSLKPVSNGCLSYLKTCIAELESSRQLL